MRRMLFWYAAALVVVTLMGLRQSDDFRLELAIDGGKESYLIGEPIFAKVVLTNTSGKDHDILFAIRSTTIIIIKDEKGNEMLYYPLSVDYRGGIRAIKRYLKRNGQISCYENLLEEHYLSKPGIYTLQAVYKSGGQEETWQGSVKSNERTIVVKAAESEEDKKAYKVLDKAWYFTFFYSSNVCEEILKSAPTSTYAKYARFFLAESHREIGIQDSANTAIELYTKVVEEKFVLSDDAQLGIAKCYVIKEDYETAAKEAQKVIDTYPDGNSVDGAKKLLKEIETNQEGYRNSAEEGVEDLSVPI